MKIGVISDTHGKVDPLLPELFRGVDAILHGGDVVGEHVLSALSALAPVHAVAGNCDGPPLSKTLPPWRMVELGHERALLLHDVGTPERLRPAAAKLIASERPSLVVSGHSHKGRVDERDGVLFLNPGSAGPRRFSLPRTVALLHVGARQVRVELLSLEGQGTLAELKLRR